MKNFTKLLMAVVLFVSYSCVQDTTEDLAPVISESGSGSGEVSTLQVNLPKPTRTELGDSYVDDEGKTKYPVYWSEGDVLAVNGKPSTGISINEGDKSSAIFKMPLGASVPYNIVYPYQGDDVTVNAESGTFPVVFPAKQKYTEGTFAQGAAPMYAWSNGFDDVTMHHLTTILRFGIKAKSGEAVDLRYVSVSTLNSEPIAGLFDVYCGSGDENDERAGELTARDGAASTIFYNFDNDSFELDEEEKVFYIAIPHGEYSGFEVNFVDVNGGVCVRTFDADGDAALLPGRVRKFPTFEFNVDSRMKLIGSDEGMLEFASLVENGGFDANDKNKFQGVVLINDVDMSNQDWTPIDERFDCVFEGREYAITGMKTPLFGDNIKAKISNLSIEAQIEEIANGKVGVIARSLAVGGEIFNCTTKGAVTYNNKTLNVTGATDEVNVGGVVGCVYGGKVTNSESFVKITIANSAKAGESKPYKPCVGGIVGYVCTEDAAAVTVVANNNNRGDVVWFDESGATAVIPFIGGVAGYVTAGTFTDNINSGILSIDTDMDDLDWGGVVGVSSVAIDKCENKGSMTINKTINTANIGGVIGKLEANPISITNCKNSGNLKFDSEFKINDSCNIGGVIALAEAGTEEISHCSNYGTIEYLGECRYKSADDQKNNASVRIGGVVGLAYTKVLSDCTNALGSDMHISGKLASVYYNLEPNRTTTVSGVVGTHWCTDPDSKIENCSNAGAVKLDFQYCGIANLYMSACIGYLYSPMANNCDNLESGSIEITVSALRTGSDNTVLTTQETLVISSIVGRSGVHAKIQNCDNSGRISYDDASVNVLKICGIVGVSPNKNIELENCNNQGELVVGANTDFQTVYMGGIIAKADDFDNITMVNCSNSNTIKFGGVSEKLYLGGVRGNSPIVVDKDQGSNIGNMNKGKIVFSETAKTYYLYLGGYCGEYEEGYHNLEFKNSTNMHSTEASIECAGTVTDTAYIGGFAGYAIFAITPKREGISVNDCEALKVENTGLIKVTDTACLNNVYIAGACGYATNYDSSSNEYTGHIRGLANSGTIEIATPKTKDATQYPTSVYMGGIAGYLNLGSKTSSNLGTIAENTKFLKDCDNNGTIIYNGIANDGAYIGGVVGKAYNAYITNCNNFGKVASAGNAGNSESSLTLSNERTEANFSKQLRTHDLAIGGVVGEINRDISNCTNKGEVYHECIVSPIKVDLNHGESASSRFDIGGVVGRVYTETAATSQHVVNLLTLKNESKVGIDGDYPYCTTNSTSVGESNYKIQSNDIDDGDRTNLRIFYRMNLAGVVGRLHDHSTINVQYYLNDCSNAGEIYTEARAKALKNFAIAGVAADILASHVEFDGAINNGNIKLSAIGEGTAVSTTTYHKAYFINIGGVAAQYIDYRLYTNKLLSGNIYNKTLTFRGCQNSGAISYNEVAASNYKTAAGILGTALNMITISAKNSPSDLELRFENCANTGTIEHKSSGLALKLSHQTVDSSIAGGIAGNIGGACRDSWYQRFAAIDLIVDNCENTAALQFERNSGSYSPNTAVNTSMVGGIVGCYVGGIGCANVTGIVDENRYMRGTTDSPYYYSANITNSTNNGRIYGFSGVMGGILGFGRWFVTIDNATNNGEIVVQTKNANGDSVYRNVYGDKKIINAGGIAGMLVEYDANNRHFQEYSDDNEGHLPYKLGSQSVNVRNSINNGNVGATNYAGGIVGRYRSARAAAEAITGNPGNGGCIENCTNTGNIYSLDGMTNYVGAIVGSSRMFWFAVYTHGNVTKNDESDRVLEQAWHVGVRNCKIGGKVLRGANILNVANADNYENCIYGEPWMPEYESIIEGAKYDGCTLYGPINDAE